MPPRSPLRRVNTNNTSSPRITATAGTKLVGAYSLKLCHYLISIQNIPIYTFIVHVILLDRTLVHCPRFPTAAFRKKLGFISIPMWLYIRLRSAKDQRLGALLTHKFLILHEFTIYQ